MSDIVQLDSGSGASWEVRVIFHAGGALLLGDWPEHEDAMAAARTWALSIHREGRPGVVVVSR